MQKNPIVNMDQIWTSQRISRFWDMVAEEPRLHNFYFSRHHAKHIINVARLYGMTRGEILDYGCGLGFLSEELVKQGFQTTAIENSPVTVEKANKLLDGQLGWNGCYLNKPSSEHLLSKTFDWVFSIEAYEHLRNDWIDAYFHELKRYMKPNGRVLITTPNGENLHDSLIICPCCEEKFHRWGHLRSVTKKSFEETVKSYGFEIELCFPINLHLMDNLKVTMIDKIYSLFVSIINTSNLPMIDNFSKFRALQRRMKKEENRHHLIMIARKTIS